MTTTYDFPPGPFTSASVLANGCTRRTLRDAVTTRSVRRVLRGVYVRADEPDDLETRAAAARLVIATGSVLRDRTAAWLHGVDCFTYAEHAVLPPIETCAPRFAAPTVRAGIDGGTRDLARRDVEQIGDLLVTTPLRTALDLGCHLRRRDALAALDQFERLHGLNAEQLTAEARRFRRRRGVVQLRQLIPIADPRPESPRESWTRLEVIDAGLPCPELQWWVEIDGVPTYRLDLAYPKHRVCVEYDGEDFHETSEEQREYDAARRAWLEAHGWTIIVVRKGDFARGASDRWTQQLAEALRTGYSNRRWRL